MKQQVEYSNEQIIRFRKYQDHFAKFSRQNSANHVRILFSFLKVVAKFRQNFIKITSQNGKISQTNILLIEKFNLIQYSICKNYGRFFAEILNLERCKGLQIL